MRPEPLSPDRLRWRCPADAFDFESTDGAAPTDRIVGQERAEKAVRLALEIPSLGYNMFVTGVSGTGRETTVKRILDSLDLSTDDLRDIVCVHNFTDPERPLILEFPADEGEVFVGNLEQCRSLLKSNIPAVMASERTAMERRAVQSRLKARQQEVMKALDEEARAKGFAIVSIPVSPEQVRPDVMPMIDGQPVTFEQLEQLEKEGKLEPARRREFVDSHEALFTKLIDALRKNHRFDQEARAEDMELVQRLLTPTVEGILARLKEKAADKVVAYADSLKGYIFENLESFINPGPDEDPFYLFTANQLVDNSGRRGRPVVIEQFPDHVSLFGNVDRIMVDSKPYSDFTMIRAGSLLKADGGYIIMDAMDLLRQPNLWPVLMQTLRNQTVVIRPHDPLNLYPVDLQPEPVQINVKVILLGSSYLYSMLGSSDPEFSLLFRIRADFDDHMDLTPMSLKDFANVLVYVTRSEKLPPFTSAAVGALAERAVRMADRKDKISTEFSRIADFARQAAYWARQEGSSVVDAPHVRRAVLEKRSRLSIGEDHAIEDILKGEMIISTEGSAVGQINGLVVLSDVDYSFGLPMRVTARVSAGREGVINIEREAEMSGSLHTKGVLIITGFLRGRFAVDYPLSLSASICIEQSYGGVEGDSASSTELYAILSALSGFPLRQDLAVTGSVNQHGEIQPIGGVNHKIEGFFKVCSRRGLTGTQGVLIPASNIDHLQLDPDVVEAVSGGLFNIYPVSTIDEGVELLTGVPAGEPGIDGVYPPGTVNGEADRRLRRMAEIVRSFCRGD